MADKATPEGAPPGERIAKVLSRRGIASRREAERLIETGEVAVNGKVITSPASISRSASRREATPRRDRTLAMRSPSGVDLSAMRGNPCGMRKPGAVRPRTPEDI